MNHNNYCIVHYNITMSYNVVPESRYEAESRWVSGLGGWGGGGGGERGGY